MNFQLRGSESDDDQKFVRGLADAYNIPFYTRDVQTMKYAGEKGVSTQMAARQLRYEFFEEVMKGEEYVYLLMAHHLNDTIETSLFNFVKGTGAAGMRGIPLRTERVLRPLLFTTRDEILHYALENELNWREDSSNQDLKYHRNYLRHSIIPGLMKINPSLERTYLHTRKRLEAATDLIRQEASNRKDKFWKVDGNIIYIKREAFEDLNIAVVEELLRPFNCTLQQVEDLLDGIRNDRSPVQLECAGHTIVLDREAVVITEESHPLEPLEISRTGGSWQHPLGKVVARVSGKEEGILKEKYAVTFDLDKLKDPLVLRKWEQGDRIKPLGMKGKKKVSDLMIDEKIPLNLKDRVCVLTSGDDIIWVAGIRISDDVKVEPSTTSFLHIVIEND
jgi:tRNA(Ile)-lysidine synthase